MRDDPYPSRYYPRVQQEPTLSSTAAELPERFSPLQRYTLRLLLFLIICYALLGLLMLLSPGSYAVPMDAPAVLEPAWDCAGTKLAGL